MQAIAANLFTDEAQPRPIGGKDRATGRIVFPCPPGEGYEPVVLGAEGRLWSYTVQRFRPKSPPYAGTAAFAPWIVAYVELPGEAIIEARLTGIEPDDVRIGMPVRFAPAPMDLEEGGAVLIPAFVPAENAA